MLTTHVQDLWCEVQVLLASPPTSSSLPILYGAVLVLVYHSPASVVTVFCPYMQLLVGHLVALSETGAPSLKKDVSKVMDAVFVSQISQEIFLS